VNVNGPYALAADHCLPALPWRRVLLLRAHPAAEHAAPRKNHAAGGRRVLEKISTIGHHHPPREVYQPDQRSTSLEHGLEHGMKQPRVLS
jgi:hypothetical protein